MGLVFEHLRPAKWLQFGVDISPVVVYSRETQWERED
jgi:hypothetical protein